MPTMPKPDIFGKIKDWTNDPSKGDSFSDYSKDGWYPIWMQPQDDTQKLLDETDKNSSGLDYKYFADILKNYISQGDPNQTLYKQKAVGDVNKTFDKGSTTLKENLAGSGMLRSGVGQNAFATLEGGRANAIGGVDTQLAAQDQSFRQSALKNLLGLFGQETSQAQGWKEFLMNLQNNQKQFDWQKNFTEEQSKFDFWRDLFPGLISAGGNIGAAAAMPGAAGAGATAASDRRLKENISKVGISPSGINIYDFNFIGHPQKFRGVMAQEVPQAAIERNGILFVDYSKIDVNFEAV